MLKRESAARAYLYKARAYTSHSGKGGLGMELVRGIAASAGLAVGTVRRLRHIQTGLGRVVMSPAQEFESFCAAAEIARAQLEEMEKKADSTQKDILGAQRMMLDDEGLREEIERYIKAGAGAAAAVERAAGIFAGRIRALDNDYMRERACDVLDACYRVVEALDDSPRQILQLSGPAIIAAHEIYPTDIFLLDRSLILGFITAQGSVNAHAAQLARTMGIPAVVMAGEDFLEACDGRLAALDGNGGEAYLDPDEGTKARFSHSIRLSRRRSLTKEKLREAICVTRDGTRITLMASCATQSGVAQAMEEGAEGIGLLQSEYQLLAQSEAGEDAQVRFYSQCLVNAKGKPVTIATYDFSTDKQPPGFEAPPEKNPALGLRGVRYSLAHPQLLRSQFAALLRVGVAGSLRVALPMVSSREEMERALDIMHETKRSLREAKRMFNENVPVGVVVETPAAALCARELAQKAAFFCVDLANLAQYTHAADRTQADVQPYFSVTSQAVQQLVGMVLEAAKKANIPMVLCCDNAAQPSMVESYARLGVRCFSMAAGDILPAKEYLMGMSLQ